MLWYKLWLDTQRWFILGMIALSAQVVALYMSYPMDPATTYPNGALGVSLAEMSVIRHGGFREYVWIRWFSTTMLLIWPVFVAAIAGSGFERSAGREYFLLASVTRRRIVGTRLALAFAQIAALTVLPTLLICAMAPLVGQRYPVGDALIHSLILCVGGLGLFGLTMFLSTVTTDLWGVRRRRGDRLPMGPDHICRERLDAVQRLPRDERGRLLLCSAHPMDGPRDERAGGNSADLRFVADGRTARLLTGAVYRPNQTASGGV